jgi:hypothetical protein
MNRKHFNKNKGKAPPLQAMKVIGDISFLLLDLDLDGYVLST